MNQKDKGGFETNAHNKLSNSHTLVPFKEMIKIPFVKHGVMKFLGLKTEEKDENPYGLNIGVLGFISKLGMPVQFFEIVKLPSSLDVIFVEGC